MGFRSGSIKGHKHRQQDPGFLSCPFCALVSLSDRLSPCSDKIAATAPAYNLPGNQSHWRREPESQWFSQACVM